MSQDEDLPKEIRQFVFAVIDSVEQLEVLLFLRKNKESVWTAQAISDQLRSSPPSIESRLSLLISSGLIKPIEGTPISYRYEVVTEEVDQLIQKLSEEYKLRPQKLLTLIFSPLKKGRDFADAFVLAKKTTKGSGENNG